MYLERKLMKKAVKRETLLCKENAKKMRVDIYTVHDELQENRE